MRKRRQLQIASTFALLIAALSLSACSSQQSSGKVSYKQTAEASLDKGWIISRKRRTGFPISC